MMLTTDLESLQEITAVVIETGIYNTLFNDYNLSRNKIFEIIRDWASEFVFDQNRKYWSFYDQIDEFVGTEDSGV